MNKMAELDMEIRELLDEELHPTTITNTPQECFDSILHSYIEDMLSGGQHDFDSDC